MKNINVEMKREGLTMETDQQQFAMALKTWRLRKGYTQKKLAELWQVSRFTIMRAEAARNMTWEMIYKLFAKLSWELEREAKHQ